jgi:DNA-binding NtrC family response regulator
MEKKCVLIYDDDIEILNVCKAILASENYHVEALLSCENIISDIEELNPQVIVIDLWIPTIGGETAIKLIRENEKTKEIPVILFSATNNIEEISERVHAKAFVKKPFDIKSFRKTIEENIL